MAVAVGPLPFVILDEGNRIVEVGPAARAGFESLLGANVLDAFPGSQPVFGPYYEKARRTGQPVEFGQFYEGRALRVRAVPGPRGLTVTWATIGILDVLTLDGLRASLESILDALSDVDHELSREELRRSLTVLKGGRR